MRSAKVAVVLMALSIAADASAECLPDRKGKEQVVIRTHDGKRLKGVLVCVDAEKAIFISGHTTHNLPRSAIDSVVTTRDSVLNGFAMGALIGAVTYSLGSHEAHLRVDPPASLDAARVVLGFGGIGALIDALRHRGGRTVPLPDD